jgi:nitrogen-specific signal transduction histidine kinase
MKTTQQVATTHGIATSSVTNIAHELANSINAVFSAVQLLERDLKTEQNHAQELISGAITNLKDQCSRMHSFRGTASTREPTK